MADSVPYIDAGTEETFPSEREKPHGRLRCGSFSDTPRSAQRQGDSARQREASQGVTAFRELASAAPVPAVDPRKHITWHRGENQRAYIVSRSHWRPRLWQDDYNEGH